MSPVAARIVCTLAAALIVLCAFTLVKNPDGQLIMVSLASGLAGSLTGGVWMQRPGDVTAAQAEAAIKAASERGPT